MNSLDLWTMKGGNLDEEAGELQVPEKTAMPSPQGSLQ